MASRSRSKIVIAFRRQAWLHRTFECIPRRAIDDTLGGTRIQEGGAAKAFGGRATVGRDSGDEYQLVKLSLVLVTTNLSFCMSFRSHK